MTKATITRKSGYKCAPTGSVVEAFAFGETVHGKAADMAIADGAASVEKKLSHKIKNKKLAPKLKDK